MKNLLFGGVRIPSAIADLGFTVFRVGLGLCLALGHGLGKIPVKEGFVNGVESLGFPIPVVFAWAAALAETAGGFLLAAGLLTRPAAFAVLCTMGVAAFMMHGADPFFLKDAITVPPKAKELAILYGMGAFVFLIAGSGRFAIDRALRPTQS